jgi:hypothetical protein
MNEYPNKHRSLIHNILNKHVFPDYDLQSIKTIQQFIIPPWTSFSIDIQNLKINKIRAKEIVINQICEKKRNNESIVFTDGSNIPGKGTALAAILNNSFSFAFRINNSDKASAFKAEVQAINIGLDITKNKFVKNNLPFSN